MDDGEDRDQRLTPPKQGVLTYEAPAKIPLVQHPLVRSLKRIGGWMFFGGIFYLFIFIRAGRYMNNHVPMWVLQFTPMIACGCMILGGVCLVAHAIVKWIGRCV